MSDFIRHFSPQRSRPEDLEKIFVQRESLLAESVEKLRRSVLARSKHHLLFVGPRGAGKTHMVALIQHRLSNLKDIEDRVRIAWLNEDETSTSFLKLFMRIYRALATRYPQEFILPLESITRLSADEALDRLSHTFLEHLHRRCCIVLIENLDALFKSMPEGELRRWRAFLQNHQVIATVGTAQTLFEGVSRRDHVFFGFFEISHLKPLSAENARELLKKLTVLGQRENKEQLLAYLDSPKGRARLGAIYHLTGGSPRLYLILADFLTRDTLDALVPAFERMVDQQLTPYYQERLRWLSVQQREIVEYLCQIHHPIVPVKTIADALFAEHSSIASQLKKLRALGYVISHPRGREVYYELAEPLMRLSFQVKEAAFNGTQGPAPLRLIVDMLRVWFEEKQLEESLASLSPGIASRMYYQAALAETRKEGTNFCADLFRQSLGKVNPEKCTDEEFSNLEALAAVSDDFLDIAKYAGACFFRSKHQTAIQSLTGPIGGKITSRQLSFALFLRAINENGCKKEMDAISDLSRAIDIPDIPKELLISSLNLRAAIYFTLKQFEEAARDYSRIINIPDASAEQVAKALNERGAILSKLGRDSDATLDYNRVVALPDAPVDEIAHALTHRSLDLAELGRWEETLADSTRLMNLPDVATHYQISMLLTRGFAFYHLGRYQESLNVWFQIPTKPKNSSLMKLLRYDGVASYISTTFIASLFAVELTAELKKTG